MNLAFTNFAFALTIALMTVCGSHASADEEFYRWRDAAGNPVNSDRPPPQGIDYEVISTKSSMVRPVDAREGVVPLQVQPTADNDFKTVDSQESATQKNPEYCARAKDNLLQIDSHGRVRMRDKQGDVRYLTVDEKAAERQKALEAIKVYCK